MWDLPLNSLRAFAAIYATGGVRSAARKLGIAHSSVSRHLSELESWIGIDLTFKGTSTRRLKFTPQGHAIGHSALNNLRDLATTVASVREVRSESSVQIGAAPSFAVRWLLPRLPALESSHPQIELSVTVDRKLSELLEHDLDLVITMGPRRPLDPRWQKLMGDALYPVMSLAFWTRHGRPSRPEDLVGLRLLHDRDPDASWGEWRSVHGPENLEVSKGPRFSSTDLVLRAAACDQGVALARHQLARSAVAAGTLLRPLGQHSQDQENANMLVLPRHKLPTPATRTVIEWLKREATRPSADESLTVEG